MSSYLCRDHVLTCIFICNLLHLFLQSSKALGFSMSKPLLTVLKNSGGKINVNKKFLKIIIKICQGSILPCSYLLIKFHLLADLNFSILCLPASNFGSVLPLSVNIFCYSSLTFQISFCMLSFLLVVW